jgi:hypothetical protein
MPEPARHEHSDIETRRVAIVIGAIAVMVLASCAAAWLVLRGFGVRDFAGATIVPDRKPHYLTATPRVSLDDFTRAKQSALERYAWEDGTRRFAQVPVDIAMQAMAQSGQGGAPP